MTGLPKWRFRDRRQGAPQSASLADRHVGRDRPAIADPSAARSSGASGLRETLRRCARRPWKSQSVDKQGSRRRICLPQSPVGRPEKNRQGESSGLIEALCPKCARSGRVLLEIGSFGHRCQLGITFNASQTRRSAHKRPVFALSASCAFSDFAAGSREDASVASCARRSSDILLSATVP